MSMQNLKGDQYPKKGFFLLNGSALIMSLLIVVLSTHIRLGEAGLGCDPWPECYAQLPLSDGIRGLAIPDSDYRIFRSMHRFIASALGLNVLLILLTALRYRKTISPLLPVFMFLVVLFLSLLGIATPARNLPLVTMGNILGGIILSGLVWRQLLQYRDRGTTRAPFILVLFPATLTVLLISGAWASANYTGSACPKLLKCSYTDDIPANLASSFNVFRTLRLDRDHRLVLDETASIIQFSHRLIALVLLILCILAGWIVKNRQSLLLKPMLIVGLLFMAEFILGVINVLADMPLWSNTLHNLLAVLLLLAMINLTTLIQPRRND